MERIQTVVIGAGQAGLATSYHLTKRDGEHVVLEQGRVGETQEVAALGQLRSEHPELGAAASGLRVPGAGPRRLAPLVDVIAYLEGYALAFDAPVRTGVGVTQVGPNDSRFLVETSAGPFEADSVVVAAGANQRPTPSPFAPEVPAEVLHCTRASTAGPTSCPQVASSSSAAANRDVTSPTSFSQQDAASISRSGAAPGCPAGTGAESSFTGCWRPGSRTTRSTAFPPLPPALAAIHRCPGTTAVTTAIHGGSGRGATLVDRIEGIDKGVAQLGGGLEETLANGDEFLANFERRVDEYVREEGLEVPEPEPEAPPAPVPLVTTLDLRSGDIGTIVWANGFRPDHSWIEGVEKDDQGWPVQIRGVSPLPGLFFVGLHWLHKRKSSLFFGVGEDAAHVVERLASRDPRA